jgi:sn-glycerol 3-phosphate transport system ATP-binding protein/multiple sugar transport system ATP-binding protein
MAKVTIKDMMKRFPNGTIAVDNLNLDIADGEFLVLLGPSGCGKTTTLRSVAGLERQTSGDIFIGDRVVNDLPPGMRDIAFVFQFYALYPHMSVYDNIAFPLRASQVTKEEVDRRVKLVAQQLRIDHLLSRRPTRLASGDQQRVALGRAMVRQPQVFLMDEPLTNLDASLRAEMRAELKHLQADLGITMIYVTHDQTEAMSMSQRIAVMNLGVLQQVSAPLDIYERPDTLFVAGFIGNPPMSFANVTLGTDNTLQGSGFLLPLPVEIAEQVRQRQTQPDLVLGVRAEDATLSHSAEQGTLSACVVTAEPLGDETIYTLRVGDVKFRASTVPSMRFVPDENVGLSFNMDRIHLFDAKTQKRVN